jgi:hypothetical protein
MKSLSPVLLSFFFHETFAAPRACGQVIARISALETSKVADLYIESITDSPTIANLARESIISLIKYDFVAMKVCGSCEDIVLSNSILAAQASDNGDEFDFGTYCASDAYGYSATHSALVFAPLDPTDPNRILPGNIRGLVSVRVFLFIGAL